MTKLEALLRLTVRIIDLGIFFFLLIKGLLFVWEGGGGYIIFWGSSLIATAVFWAKLDKDAMVSDVKAALARLLN